MALDNLKLQTQIEAGNEARWGMAGPDTDNSETPYPIWGFGPPSPEPDTKKLDALLASLNSSAERFQTLWFSFLGLTLYLAITALATTHRNLLLGEPQTLPILNIKVELLPFYIIAPLLYLVFHFYLLMMLALLARTAAEFDKQLRTTLPGEPERERYRAQVGNALFLQLLVGMKGERTGANALLMGLIAFITIVLAPLATLVLMQMMFLPYHHLRITWWHRVVVVADLALIVVMTYRCFFPRGVRKAPLVLGALSRKRRWAAAMAFCVLLAVVLAPLVDWLSFQQGRWAGEPRPSSFLGWAPWMVGEPPWLPEGNSDYSATANGVVFGLFPDRLNLRNETIVGKEKLENAKEEIASRGGDFVPTVKVDGRDFQAADLSGADLRGVDLQDKDLRGADLSFARLDGARLPAKHALVVLGDRPFGLRGADLTYASLPYTSLEGADLQGAELRFARLQGANLVRASLQGARLEDAQLQGANLKEARLQGALLLGAQLQGADLTRAQLQGASLSNAQLQGANLRGADMEDSALVGTFIFRTNVADTDLSMTAIRSVYANQVKPVEDRDKGQRLTDDDVEGWIAAATQLGEDEYKKIVRKRFERLNLNPGFQPPEEDAADVARWAELTKQSLASDPDGARHRQRLAELLGNLACGSDGAPYVARALMGWPNDGYPARLAALRDQLGPVRERMEAGRNEPDKCPGVVGFTEDDWRALEALKPD